MKKGVLLIPTYNERGNLRSLTAQILTVVPDIRIMVVDDSSPDGTAEEARALAMEDPRVSLLLRHEKQGLGVAYVDAFKHLLQNPSIEFIGMMDADHSHDPSHLPAMLRALDHADMVVGSRYCAGGKTLGWERWRRALSIFGNLYCRAVTGIPLRETTGGFNLIRTEALRKLALDAIDGSGYAFQMELKFLLWRSEARLVEVPITFRNRREGESKLTNHIVREGLIAPWKMRFKAS